MTSQSLTVDSKKVVFPGKKITTLKIINIDLKKKTEAEQMLKMKRGRKA